jgi:hypothetical protein
MRRHGSTRIRVGSSAFGIYVNASDPRTSQLRNLKTSKGIGIGSRLGDARRAHPRGRYDPAFSFLSFGPDNAGRRTQMLVDPDTKLISGIAIGGPYLP